jgi:hypothetical protein
MTLLDIDDTNFSDHLVEDELAHLSRLVVQAVEPNRYSYEIVRELQTRDWYQPNRSRDREPLIEFNLRMHLYPTSFSYVDRRDWSKLKLVYPGYVYVYVEMFFTELGEVQHEVPFYNVTYEFPSRIRERLDDFVEFREIPEEQMDNIASQYEEDAQEAMAVIRELLENMGLKNERIRI